MILEQRVIFPEAVDRDPYLHDRHWNRVKIADVPDFEIEDWLEDSYADASRSHEEGALRPRRVRLDW